MFTDKFVCRPISAICYLCNFLIYFWKTMKIKIKLKLKNEKLRMLTINVCFFPFTFFCYLFSKISDLFSCKIRKAFDVCIQSIIFPLLSLPRAHFQQDHGMEFYGYVDNSGNARSARCDFHLQCKHIITQSGGPFSAKEHKINCE